MTDACSPPCPDEAGPRRRLFIPGVALLTLIYLSLALANIVRLPPLRGPDESDHLAYVQVLRSQHAMPLLPRFTAPDDPRVAEQAQHPPLYYAVLAAASTVLPDLHTVAGQRALKLVSVLMGLVGLLAFAVCARETWPDDDTTALAAVGFVAVMPLYWVMTSHINNTAGSLAASGVALLLLRRALADEPQPGRWLALGLTAALGMLAKITAAWLVPVIVVALWLQARRHGGRVALRLVLPALAPMVLLVGVWLTYNWFSFGELMPQRVLGREYLPLGFMTVFFQPFAAKVLLHAVLVKIPLTAFTPFWLMADAVRPRAALIVLAAFLAPPLLAAMTGAWRRRGRHLTGRGPRHALLLACAVSIPAAWFIAIEAVLHDWNTGLYAGRYAVDALPAVALLFAAGMKELLPWPRVRAAGVGLWLLALLCLALLIHCYMVAFFVFH
jgi:4-amino-4-deoxy-L-arabinose transferase-like glycosyltransferase